MKLSRIIAAALGGTILALVAVAPAMAVSGYLTPFNNLYGTSGTKLNSCTLCHSNTPSFNFYGSDFDARPHTGGNTTSAFKAIEGLDSDGDGFTNIEEITARTFPGNAADKPSTPPPPPAGPPVTVLDPNGGELIPSGSVYPVSWDADPAAASFKLGYSIDNGATWKLIAKGETGTGYNWKVPIPAKNTKALLRINAYDGAGVSLGKADRSDAPFLIEVVHLNEPASKSILYSGSVVPISWTVNATQRPVGSIILQRTVDGGLTWKKIATLLPGDTGYNWTVPTVAAAKTRCKVKVILKDSGGMNVGVVTSGYFTISP